MRLKENSLALLKTTDGVDLDAAAQTTLYTCPAGFKCYITKVVLRDISLTTGTVKISCGWNTGVATDVIALTAALVITTDNYHIPAILSDAVRGNAAETFEIDVETAEGAATTCSIDVFGYLVSA